MRRAHPDADVSVAFAWFTVGMNSQNTNLASFGFFQGSSFALRHDEPSRRDCRKIREAGPGLFPIWVRLVFSGIQARMAP
jgi:hypothetical protein